jgi:hypothetical protein
LDDHELHVRETLGGGDGPAERRPRTYDRQYEAQADQRGEDAPASIDGTLMAARRSGAVLTIGLDQAQRRARRDGVIVIFGVEVAGLELEDRGHESLLLIREAWLTSRSKQGGETATVDERLFDVKRKSERVFAPNA